MVTIKYIKSHQSEDEYAHVIHLFFEYIDELMIARKFEEVDKFIEDFCKEDICLQYYVGLLTITLWGQKYLKNIDILKKQALEVGKKIYPEKKVLRILKGLI